MQAPNSTSRPFRQVNLPSSVERSWPVQRSPDQLRRPRFSRSQGSNASTSCGCEPGGPPGAPRASGRGLRPRCYTGQRYGPAPRRRSALLRLRRAHKGGDAHETSTRRAGPRRAPPAPCRAPVAVDLQQAPEAGEVRDGPFGFAVWLVGKSFGDAFRTARSRWCTGPTRNAARPSQ